MMDSAEVSTLCVAHLPAHASCSKLDAALADFELSPFRCIALSVLAHNENLSPLRLSRRLHVTLQAMGELILILERRGLIEGHEDSVNKRALLLRLTERGRLLWTEAKAIAKIIEQTIFSGLSKAELKTSRSILSNAIAARREQPVDKRRAHHRRDMRMQSNEGDPLMSKKSGHKRRRKQKMGKFIKAISAMLVAAIGMIAASSSAWSAFPDRPIRMILSFPPGGSSDTIARIVQPLVEKKLGQTIIIENRPGAGGIIAIEYVAKSAPDGYTIGLGGAGALAANLGLQAMPYDPKKDVIAITGLASSPFILAASKKFKGDTLHDVITMAKLGQNLSIGHGGSGTLMHLTAEMFLQDAKIKAPLVSYRGIAPVVTDLMGDHIELGIVDPPSAKAALDGNAIKPIAVSSKSRFPMMPNTPTFAESGLPGFESTGWFGIVAPHGIPADVVTKLNAAFVAALNDPDTSNRIRALGSEVMPMTPSEFSTFIDSERAKWNKVVEHATKEPH